MVAIHPARNAYERRSPDGMLNSTSTASTDVGLENATASPSTATEAISVCTSISVTEVPALSVVPCG